MLPVVLNIPERQIDPPAGNLGDKGVERLMEGTGPGRRAESDGAGVRTDGTALWFKTVSMFSI